MSVKLVGLRRIETGELRSELLKQHGMTRRQYDVLVKISEGHSNKVIADRLFVSEDTVKFHIKALLKLFNVRNRTECIFRAQKAGLLD